MIRVLSLFFKGVEKCKYYLEDFGAISVNFQDLVDKGSFRSLWGGFAKKGDYMGKII